MTAPHAPDALLRRGVRAFFRRLPTLDLWIVVAVFAIAVGGAIWTLAVDDMQLKRHRTLRHAREVSVGVVTPCLTEGCRRRRPVGGIDRDSGVEPHDVDTRSSPVG